MKHFRLKKRKKTPDSFEINVTPMLDMFSVLIAFLLATAVFSSSGQIRVEIPFLSSKTPPAPTEVDKDPLPVLSLSVDKDTAKLEVTTAGNAASSESKTYRITEAGLDDLQGRLYEIRTKNPRVDKVTVMTEQEVEYEKLVMVIDTLRDLKSGRQPIEMPAGTKPPVGVDPDSLIPKIVLGNVIL